MQKLILASVVAFAVCLAVGPLVIPMLKRLKFGQMVRDDGLRPLRHDYRRFGFHLSRGLHNGRARTEKTPMGSRIRAAGGDIAGCFFPIYLVL